MIENKKNLRQEQNLWPVFELGGTLCLALISLGAHKKGYTSHFTRPNRLTPTSDSMIPIDTKKILIFIKDLRERGKRVSKNNFMGR